MTFYSSAEWQRFRAEVIAERGKRCEAPGCTAKSGRVYLDHVHELKDGGAPLDRVNVMVLCASHHGQKTARAKAARLCEPC
jgi:5-methylcytosine-specific restriction endonuclease McrA